MVRGRGRGRVRVRMRGRVTLGSGLGVGLGLEDLTVCEAEHVHHLVHEQLEGCVDARLVQRAIW